MCGIAGIVHFKGERIDPAKRMLEALQHRGPDDQGLFDDPNGLSTLVHSRLSVIDLSAGGRQPFSSEDGRYHIVFNGEIYNYQALREQVDYPWKTHSDTETLLALFIQYAEACVHKLRGMFAFAIWDSQERVLFAARDRLGIKPLYFTVMGETLMFASEIRALLASGCVPKVFNTAILSDYLRYGSIPQPHSAIANVHALMPGHTLKWKASQVEMRAYWSVCENTQQLRCDLENISTEEATDRLHEEVLEAARFHMVADVPVGVFLSGGIDSALVASAAQGFSEKTLQTFTLGLPEAFASQDESREAAQSAQYLGTNHRTIIAESKEIRHLLEQMLQSIDQPSLDGVNTYLIASFACEHFKVVMSGLGGDELFGGYRHFSAFLKILQGGRYEHAGLTRWLLSCADRVPRRLLNALLSKVAPRELLKKLPRLYCMDAHLQNMIHPELFAPLTWDATCHASDRDAFAQMSLYELEHYLVNTLLRDSDAMSMAHSLELRPILLDHKLVEYVYSLPTRLKTGSFENKYLLHQAFSQQLPESVFLRKKRGFEMPLVHWVRTEFGETMQTLINGDIAKGLFSEHYRETMLRQLKGDAKAGNTLWSIFILLSYLTYHNITISQR